MSAVEWFVVDTRTGRIVNCITTSRPGEPSLHGFVDAEHLAITRTPTSEQLRGYQFWNERP